MSQRAFEDLESRDQMQFCYALRQALGQGDHQRVLTYLEQGIPWESTYWGAVVSAGSINFLKSVCEIGASNVFHTAHIPLCHPWYGDADISSALRTVGVGPPPELLPLAVSSSQDPDYLVAFLEACGMELAPSEEENVAVRSSVLIAPFCFLPSISAWQYIS